MENSRIEWTDHTFNPWIGCQKVSDGCKFCYAETLMDQRYGRVKWGPQGTRQRTSDANWRKPLQWNKHPWYQCTGCGWRGQRPGMQSWNDGCVECRNGILRPTRCRVFCASLADVFEDREELAPWRLDLFRIIEQTPNLDWLLLTKRPQNIERMALESAGRFADVWLSDCPNVWLGVSVENQEAADERIPELLKVPARIRFLSCEPLLGPVDLFHIGSEDWDVLHGWKAKANNERGWANTSLIHWVIVGGESGRNARPAHPDWFRSLRDQCQAAGIPFLYKQWGEWVPGSHPAHGTHWDYVGKDKFAMKRVGKHAAGRLLDGVEWSEFPR